MTLPAVSEDDDALMKVVSQSNELDIFRTNLIKDYIDYKWDTFGYKFNIGNLICHSFYVLFLVQFINWNFIHCPNGYQKDVNEGKYFESIHELKGHKREWYNDCVLVDQPGDEPYNKTLDHFDHSHKKLYRYDYRTWQLWGSNVCLIYPTAQLLIQFYMKGFRFLLKRD